MKSSKKITLGSFPVTASHCAAVKVVLHTPTRKLEGENGGFHLSGVLVRHPARGYADDLITEDVTQRVDTMHAYIGDGPATRDLGSDRSQGYCLEMICPDFLAGANLDNGDPETLLFSMTGFPKFLTREQRCCGLSRWVPWL